MSKKKPIEEEILDVVEETTEVEEQDEVETLTMFDKGWTDYLLDKLYDNELFNGNPTVDGLRRLVNQEIGAIVGSTSDVLQCPTQDNQRATIRHRLEIDGYDGLRRVIDGCVDVSIFNTPAPFNKHLVGSADTRSESKALRRALNIKILSHEELQNENDDSEVAEMRNAETISDQQILAINQMAKRMDVSVQKYVKSIYKDVEYINELSNSDGKILINGYPISNVKKVVLLKMF